MIGIMRHFVEAGGETIPPIDFAKCGLLDVRTSLYEKLSQN